MQGLQQSMNLVTNEDVCAKKADLGPSHLPPLYNMVGNFHKENSFAL